MIVAWGYSKSSGCVGVRIVVPTCGLDEIFSGPPRKPPDDLGPWIADTVRSLVIAGLIDASAAPEIQTAARAAFAPLGFTFTQERGFL